MSAPASLLGAGFARAPHNVAVAAAAVAVAVVQVEACWGWQVRGDRGLPSHGVCIARTGVPPLKTTILEGRGSTTN